MSRGGVLKGSRKGREAGVGFEPTNRGFAIRSLSPLGYPAKATNCRTTARTVQVATALDTRHRVLLLVALIALLQIREEEHPLDIAAGSAQREELEEPGAIALGRLIGRR